MSAKVECYCHFCDKKFETAMWGSRWCPACEHIGEGPEPTGRANMAQYCRTTHFRANGETAKWWQGARPDDLDTQSVSRRLLAEISLQPSLQLRKEIRDVLAKSSQRQLKDDK